MSETSMAHGRDEKTGRFLAGNTGNGGRRPGARGKLGQAFLEDLRDAWNAHGMEALRRCATEEPAQFCRIVSNLLPRDVDINVSARVDATTFAEKFRAAVELLGNEPQPKIFTIENKATARAR
jgi:hypothetical protein